MNVMMAYARTWLALRADRRGVTMLEYGLIAALISVVCIGVVSSLGTDLSSVFSNLGQSIGAVANP